jgi:serine/threonine protein kinase
MDSDLEKSELLFNFSILDGKYNIEISKESIIGKGSYGKVYYIGTIDNIECVIKIFNHDDDDNEYQREIHFYKKYESSLFYAKSLPKLIDYGYYTNKIDSRKYDCIILEYVGSLTFYKILKKLAFIDTEEEFVLKMIYTCIYKHLLSFHNSKMVFRDVNPSNLVVSDKITCFFMQKHYLIADMMKKKMVNDVFVFREVTISEIIDDYKNENYEEIIRFVDAGMFCDLDRLNEIQQLDKNDNLIGGNFLEFDGLDGTFASTLNYVSPFCILRLSSMIKSYNNSELNQIAKNNVEITLKLADIWSLNIIFLIHFHDITNTQMSYEKIILSKLCYDRNNCKLISKANTIRSLPFQMMNQELYINKELFPYTIYENINCSCYLDLHNIVIETINNIIELVNNLIFISNNNINIIKDIYTLISNYEKKVNENINQNIPNLEID